MKTKRRNKRTVDDTNKSMRLRLVVRRHGLPDTRLLFNVSLEDEPTIARLLEQVNDTIPLESADWGLEDYVVEQRLSATHGDGGVGEYEAFECLHFQPVAAVLDIDDEVVVRPLTSDDLRRRRLGGRLQISRNGRHLIDGVAFGRPRLGPPRDRPPVDIPPRKRRRIAYEYVQEEGELEDGDGDLDEAECHAAKSPLMLTGPEESNAVRNFDDADPDRDGDDEESDGDFEFGGDDTESDGSSTGVNEDEPDEEIDDDEIQFLKLDMADIRGSMGYQGDGKQEAEEGSVRVSGSEELDLTELEKIAALKAAFPTAEAGEVYKCLLKCRHNFKKAYKKLRKSHKPHLKRKEMLEYHQSITLVHGEAEAESVDDVEEEEVVDQRVRHFDRHGFPPGSLEDGTAAAHAAEVFGEGMKLPTRIVFDENDSGAASSTARASKGDEAPTVDEKDSSSEESFQPPLDSESESEGDGESHSEAAEGAASQSEEDEESSSDGDERSGSEEYDAAPEVEEASESDSDNEDSATGSSLANQERHAESDASPSESSSQSDLDEVPGDASDSKGSTGDSNDEAEDSEEDSSSGSEPEERSTKPPEEALAPESQQAQTDGPGSRIQSSPLTAATVPPGQGKEKTKKRNARRRAASRAKKIQSAEAAGSMDAAAASGAKDNLDLLARQQALLQALAGPSAQPTLPDQTSQRAIADEPSTPYQMRNGEETGVNSTESADESSRALRRTRLDVGAGRRMIFGALGVRNPKTKVDEDKIRTDLMKDVRPLANHRMLPNGDTADVDASGDVNDRGEQVEEGEDEDESDDAWRDKIIYRAVECCHDGVELSEPPFPFVQRWDPQQHIGWDETATKVRRGGRKKRKHRDQSHYYEGDEQSSAKKRKFGEPEDDGVWDDSFYNGEGKGDPSYADIGLNYDDEVPAAQHKKIDFQVTDLDDLPSLPNDLSILPQLHPTAARIGMVITWKQMLLSSATGWQPQVLDRTAIVLSVEDNGSMLDVILAKRDRNLDRNKKMYDDTGKRVYDRFEAPDVDGDEDDESAEDSGNRTVCFSEMMEPRIVQQPLNIDVGSRLEDHPSVVADSQPNHENQNGGGIDGLSGINGEPPTTRDNDAQRKEQGRGDLAEYQVDRGHDSIIPETMHGESSRSRNSTQPAQRTSAPTLPIAEDRSHEISLMISRAAFRKSISPVMGDDPFVLGSPLGQPNGMFADVASETSQRVSRSPPHQPVPNGGESSPMVTFEGGDDFEDADMFGSSELENHKPDTPYSPVDSPRSGRQPDPAFSTGLSADLNNQGENRGDESVQLDMSDADSDDGLTDRAPAKEQLNRQVGDAVAAHQQAKRQGYQQSTPTQPGSKHLSRVTSASPSGETSPCSLPSLSEIFFTAQTSRKTQSPAKSALMSALKARKSATHPDLEYEEAMRKLDEIDEEDESGGGSPSLVIKKPATRRAASMPDSSPPASQTRTRPQTNRVTSVTNTFDNSISPPSLPKSRLRRSLRKSPPHVHHL